MRMRISPENILLTCGNESLLSVDYSPPPISKGLPATDADGAIGTSLSLRGDSQTTRVDQKARPAVSACVHNKQQAAVHVLNAGLNREEVLSRGLQRCSVPYQSQYSCTAFCVAKPIRQRAY